MTMSILHETRIQSFLAGVMKLMSDYQSLIIFNTIFLASGDSSADS